MVSYTCPRAFFSSYFQAIRDDIGIVHRLCYTYITYMYMRITTLPLISLPRRCKSPVRVSGIYAFRRHVPGFSFTPPLAAVDALGFRRRRPSLISFIARPRPPVPSAPISLLLPSARLPVSQLRFFLYLSLSLSLFSIPTSTRRIHLPLVCLSPFVFLPRTPIFILSSSALLLSFLEMSHVYSR